MTDKGSVWVCRDGMAVALRDAANAPAGVVATGPDWTLLPACRDHDEILAGQPPLALRLSNSELRELNPVGSNAPFAATCYGPPQDKQRNEDAALAAVIKGRDHQGYAVTIVADGVGTRTFWAERSARIACLAAYKTIRGILRDDVALQRDEVEAYRRALSTDLVAALREDRDLLLRRDAVPQAWEPDLYRSRRERLELWYNTTLLIGCLGPDFGLVFWVGDGCVLLRKSAAEPAPVAAPMRSTDDLRVDSFVSLVAPIAFAGGVIAYDDWDRIELVLGTDGFDRTAQRENDEVVPRIFAAQTANEACETLEQLSSSPLAEVDNYSVAHASWPLPPVAADADADADGMPVVATTMSVESPALGSPLPDTIPGTAEATPAQAWPSQPQVAPDRDATPSPAIGDPPPSPDAEPPRPADAIGQRSIAPIPAPAKQAPDDGAPAEAAMSEPLRELFRLYNVRDINEFIQLTCEFLGLAALQVYNHQFHSDEFAKKKWPYLRNDFQPMAIFRWFALSYVFGREVAHKETFDKLLQFASVRKMLSIEKFKTIGRDIYADEKGRLESVLHSPRSVTLLDAALNDKVVPRAAQARRVELLTAIDRYIAQSSRSD